jgi:antitoxin (DNA-binding transcriptional repressor) of toxin-antitoxin stability system
MEKATISQLKNSLSAYLDKVRSGVTVLVLDRNRPIARIERAGGADAQEDDRIASLERTGQIRRGTQRMPLAHLKSKPPGSAGSVLETLLDERRNGR